jgi:hypothetical protein
VCAVRCGTSYLPACRASGPLRTNSVRLKGFYLGLHSLGTAYFYIAQEPPTQGLLDVMKKRNDLPTPAARPAPVPFRRSYLPPEYVLELERWNLPLDRPHRLADYKAAGLVKNAAHARKLRAAGILGPGHWLGRTMLFWYASETAEMIRRIPTERPPAGPPRQKPPRAAAGAPAPIEQSRAGARSSSRSSKWARPTSRLTVVQEDA